MTALLRQASFVDITGQKFGRLTVLSRAAQGQRGRAAWVCQCECGATVEKDGTRLRSGMVKSCGCLLSRGNPTHGMKGTRTYGSWQAMRARCNNPRNPDYAAYGGRGIGYPPEWDDFRTFLSDMGERPEGKTLDRKDNNANYGKQNCRWADDQQQARNRRTTKRLEFRGAFYSCVELAEMFRLNPVTLSGRIGRGWSVEAAATTKPRHIERISHDPRTR